MEELKKEAVIPFTGYAFYEAVYEGKKHLATIVDTRCVLISKEPVSEKSEFKHVLYITECTIDELDDLFKSRLTAQYKGLDFDVGKVSAGIDTVELISNHAERCFMEEDLGFTFDRDVSGNHKLVPASKLDELTVTRTSIYEAVKARIARMQEQ